MATSKDGFSPSPQKINPKGKYNEKKWVKLGVRDLVNIDEMDMLIYNNMDITHVYDKMDESYAHYNRVNTVGRPKKTKNE